MKAIQKQIIPSLGIALFLAAISAPPALANPLTSSQIQQVNSGLFRSNSQDFFEEGRRKLDKEIEILLQRLLTSDREILEIDEKLRSELCSGELKISAQQLDRMDNHQLKTLNARVKQICTANPHKAKAGN
ncbi:hypothetical protein [Kamptonema sp. UHCC 0994]|uniref:hypothetical protein n=1 Tax=Kamptonema sp. UHCC 0994 TaxID=3031329 RepID=UPI0023B88E5D|nr:hypothetical protein [Kamptonema sp. UHCC 0994]MDF0552057.1 hypothetical protein [Kamptonema sp. UHCC 0994]